MKFSIEIGGGLLKNTVLNLAGQLVPLIIAVGTIPVIIRGLGTERFGVLALVWVVLGYFSLFDLGLGRATTKFVAEALGKNEFARVPYIFWSSLALHAVLGMAGGGVLVAITPVLSDRVFNIPPAIVGETRSAFYIVAASLPAVVLTSAVRGTLEAGQRFDLVNAVRIPSASVIYLIPAIALPFGLGLPGIVVLLSLSRLCTALAYLLLCFKVLPLKKIFRVDPAFIYPLLIFGGWVAVSNALLSLLVSLDRFLIGSILTVSAVTYYTAPYEMVTRLWILPMSLSMVLFPAFSSLGGARKEELGCLYSRAVKYLLLVMGPVVLSLTVFASDILRLWLGNNFAQESTLVFRILTFGVLLSSLAIVPQSFLQGIGRADITAKLYLLELAFYMGVAWYLTKWVGITGAAVAWSLRSGLDVLLLFGASRKFSPTTIPALSENGVIRVVTALSCLGLSTLAVVITVERSLVLQVCGIAGLVLLFILVSWQCLLNVAERASLTLVAGQMINSLRRKDRLNQAFE